MNWLKKKIIAWAMQGTGPQLMKEATVGPMSRDIGAFDGVEQIRITIFNVSNGTLVRMDARSDEDYVVRSTGPRRPPVFIVKDGETVQDVIVRQLAIAALER
jgi:hypothetical protein